MNTEETFNKFIVFEGIDGSGKTYHSQALVERLKLKGLQAVHTYEPTDALIGKLIRTIIKDYTVYLENVRAMPLLFAADRYHHIDNIWKLLKNYHVVCDRYEGSSYAYQLEEDNAVTYEWLETLHEATLTPDVVFYLDVEIPTAMERMSSRGREKDAFETQTKLQKVKENYETYINHLPDRSHMCNFYRINANVSIYDVIVQIDRAMKDVGLL